MELFLSLLLFVVIWACTTILASFLGTLLPLLYALLGFILGIESTILGIGCLLGNLVNIYIANKYIKTQNVMSYAPIHGKTASTWYIALFVTTITLAHTFNFEINNINYWHLLFIILIVWIIQQCVLIMGIKNKIL